MSDDFKPYSISASIKDYLLQLQESGLEGIPASLPVDVPSVNQVSTGTMIEPASADESVAMAENRQHESLDEIRADLGSCQRCQLGKTRKNLVFGIGNPDARLVFVGEGPGADEDQKGEPFVGEAGQVLNRIITAMGLKREDVYICNVVKCRPPGNRDPQTEEIAACSPFLLRQVHSVKPEVIVALGKFAAQTLLGSKEPISRMRGNFRDYHGVPLMPTFHPSYLLRNKGDSAPFWDVWDDMVQVLQLLKLPVPEKSRKNRD